MRATGFTYTCGLLYVRLAFISAIYPESIGFFRHHFFFPVGVLRVGEYQVTVRLVGDSVEWPPSTTVRKEIRTGLR